MFKPWRPIDQILLPHPDLQYELRDRSLLIHWTQGSRFPLELQIVFEGCVASVLCVDESVYQSTTGLGLPGPEDFDAADFEPLPWPAWKQTSSERAAQYGDLGRLNYRSVDSYLIVGCATVLLIDVADAEPRVTRHSTRGHEFG